MLTRKLTILAQDPSVQLNGRILRAQVEVPAEELAPGPWGYRVHVVDYDSSTGSLYRPIKYPPLKNGRNSNQDPFEKASDAQLLSSPGFHAQNAYAIVMRILADPDEFWQFQAMANQFVIREKAQCLSEGKYLFRLWRRLPSRAG